MLLSNYEFINDDWIKLYLIGSIGTVTVNVDLLLNLLSYDLD
jgi:hypothetical protein